MSDALKVFAFVMMVVACFVFHTWIRTQVLTTGYQLHKTQKHIRSLDSEKFSLKIDLNRRLSPVALEGLVQDMAAQGSVFESPVSEQLHYLKVRSGNVPLSAVNGHFSEKGKNVTKSH